MSEIEFICKNCPDWRCLDRTVKAQLVAMGFPARGCPEKEKNQPGAK